MKPHFDFAWGACLYNEPLKKLIHQFKYGQKTLLRHLFSHLMISFINTYNIEIQSFDCVVPVPLFSARRRERGYNQAHLLAQPIAETFHLKLSANNLVRIRPTKTQAALTQKERWTNIQGAFKIKQPLTYRNKKILLVDDLLTTGATVSESALVLKDAGATSVGVLTLAIAV